MITYNPDYLDNTDIFTPNEIKLLEELNQKVSLEKFLTIKAIMDWIKRTIMTSFYVPTFNTRFTII